MLRAAIVIRETRTARSSDRAAEAAAAAGSNYEEEKKKKKNSGGRGYRIKEQVSPPPIGPAAPVQRAAASKRILHLRQ